MEAASDAHASAQSTLVNFGGNQTWRARCYQPRSEHDVLDILARENQIRALGSLHSWSDIAVSEVVLDMSWLDKVEPFVQGGATFVRVGAGCRIDALLDNL